MTTRRYFPFWRCPKSALTSAHGAAGSGDICSGSLAGLWVLICRCGSSWCFLPLEAACFWTRPFLGGEPWFSQCLGVRHVLFWQLCFVVLQAVLSGALWGWCYTCVQVIVRHDWRAECGMLLCLCHCDVKLTRIPKRDFIFLHVWRRGRLALDPW